MRGISSVIPRSFRWRIGRAIYMDARGDIPNDMKTNGELLLQRCVVNAWMNKKYSRSRFIAIDVGANRGEWIAHLLGLMPDDAGESGVSVAAFEPEPTTAELLRRRFKTDSRVMIEELALTSLSGQSTLYVTGPVLGTNSLHPTDQHQYAIDVSTETLSDYCKRHAINNIDVVKCDTEGNDCEVIRGASDMLASEAISVFQFEYNYRWVFARRFLKDVFDTIAGLPYRLAKLQSDHLIVFDKWHFELDRYFEGNYVLIHERAIEWMPTRIAKWDASNTARIFRK